MGNVVGSTISNILGAFSLGLIFTQPNTEFDTSSKVYSGLLLLLTSAVVAIIFLERSAVALKVFGGFLVGSFVVYVMLVSWQISKGRLTPPEDSDSDSDEESSDYENHIEPEAC